MTSIARKKWRVHVILWIFVCLALSACSDEWLEPDHAGFDSYHNLTSGQTIGQSFVSRFDGLEEIQIYLDPVKPGTGRLVFHLRESSTSAIDLRIVEISLDSIIEPGFYHLGFEPLRDSNQKAYYGFFELDGDGKYQIGVISSILGYLDGSMYFDHQPQLTQLAFRLGYEPTLAAQGFASELGRWVGIIFSAVLLMVVPGSVLFHLFYPNWDEEQPAEKWILAAGAGAVLFPFLLVWANFFGLHSGAWFVWLPVGLGFFYLLMVRGKIIWQTNIRKWFISVLKFPVRFPAETALLFLAGLLIFTRFWTVRSLVAPMWGDSVQHAVIAQLIIDHGGLFSSWLPYAPYQTLSIHFGFSTLAAGLKWLTGMETVQAVLWMGQIVNVLAVLGLYPLARVVARGNKWAGVITVLIAGWVTTIPAAYVNWGRFAQLTGQVGLPVAIWLSIKAFEWFRLRDWLVSPPLWWPTIRRIIPLGVVAAGMTFCYYRMPYFYGLFLVSWFLCWGAFSLFEHKPIQFRLIIRIIAGTGIIGILIVLAASAWLPNMFATSLYGYFKAGVSVMATGDRAIESLIKDYQVWLRPDYYLPPLLSAAAVLALIIGFRQEAWELTAVGVWTIVMAFFRVTALLKIPGAALLDGFTILIWTYMPVGIMTGWLAGWLWDRFGLSKFRFAERLVLILVIGTGLWAGWAQRGLSQPKDYALVREPDMRAMQWIRANTPPDAMFLVEGFSNYNGSAAVGSDAGWWIPVLTGRQNNLPPQYALLNEIPNDPGYKRRVADLFLLLEKEDLNSDNAKKALCDWGVDYIFIGQGQGRINMGAPVLFTPDELANQPVFSPVYQVDGVKIYYFDNNLCTK